MRAFVLKCLSTLGPIGYIPIAPGTWGTLAAAFFIYYLKPAIPLYVVVTAISMALGFYATNEAEKLFKEKDSGRIVLDEFAGYLVSMAFLPQTMQYFIYSFVLFRIFDIIKPPPLRRLQRFHGGWGVMDDDLMAGIYTNFILQLWRLLTER